MHARKLIGSNDLVDPKTLFYGFWSLKLEIFYFLDRDA